MYNDTTMRMECIFKHIQYIHAELLMRFQKKINNMRVLCVKIKQMLRAKLGSDKYRIVTPCTLIKRLFILFALRNL